MENKTKILIAVGAAVTANCQPCLRTLLKKARENGVQDKEILEAVGVAKLVRKNSATQIDHFLAGLAGSESETGEPVANCGCT